MKRLFSLSLALFCSLGFCAELRQQQAVVVPSPSPNGYWSATDRDGKQFTPQTLTDGSALVTVPCVLSWSASPITSTTVVVGTGPVVPPAPGPTATISANPEKIVANGKTLVSWKAGGTAVSATMQVGTDAPSPVGLAGEMQFAPRANTDYTLRATAADGTVATAKCTVVVDGTGPQPKPVDPPAPQPGPMNVTTLYVTVIYESGDLTVEQSRVLNDAAVVKWLADGKHKYREIDDDVKDAKGKVPAELANHLKLAAEVGEPAVIVTDDAGTVLSKFRVPASAAELLRNLQQLTTGRAKP